MRKRILSFVLGLAMIAVAAVNPLLSSTAGTVKAADAAGAAALPTDVTFDDLGTIAGENTVTIEATKVNQTLGEIKSDESGTKNGFSFLMPKAQVGNYIYFGLYNTGTDLYNEGGFVICFGKNASDANAVDYWTYANYPKADGSWGQYGTGSGKVSNLTGDDIKVSVWLEGTNATTGDSLIKILVGDTEITMKESTQPVEIGSYMTVRNDAKAAIDIKTVNPVEIIPSNVIFESLGDTLGVLSVEEAFNSDGDGDAASDPAPLGQVSDLTTGFKAIMPVPKSTSDWYSVGLYNQSNFYSKGGYQLWIQNKGNGTVSWGLLTNDAGTSKGSGTISGVTDDQISMYAWLNDSNKLNVVLNDTLIIKDVEVVGDIGTYMSVCVNTGADIEVNTTHIPENAYIDISTYRTDGNYTIPTEWADEDVVFAGWYEDSTFTKPLTAEDVQGRAYAKWVPKGVLSVKWQMRDHVKEDGKTDSDAKDLRFVTTVDSEFYKKVGFEIKRDDIVDQTASVMANKVYRRINAGDQKVTADATFNSSSKYFMTRTITGLSQNDYGVTITVTPKWETMDGTTVTGVSATVNVQEKLVSTSTQ